MRILAVDTSTNEGAIALLEDQVLLAVDVNRTESHSIWLLRAIDRLIHTQGAQLASLDAYVVAIGPGSFTGLRIGISTVKGLAAASRRPCFGVCTLDAMAETLAEQWPDALLAPVIDARKKEVYFAKYRATGGAVHCLLAPRAAPPEEFVEASRGACVGGSGIEVCRALLGAEHQIVAIGPAAPAIARRGDAWLRSGQRGDPDKIEPLYLRKSEAELAERK